MDHLRRFGFLAVSGWVAGLSWARLSVLRPFSVCYLASLALALSGCEPSWRTQFPNGTKLYERDGHRYFGKVTAFEATHDFHNGTPPGPAVLIEPAEAGQTPQWGSCSTCAATFQLEAP